MRKAIDFASSRKFSINHALGIVDVRDQAAIEQIQLALEQAAETTDTRLLGHVRDAGLD